MSASPASTRRLAQSERVPILPGVSSAALPGVASRDGRRLACAGLLLLLGWTSGGCRLSGGAAPLELWALGREGEVVRQLIPAFERQNPGVRVRVQQVPWSAAHEKLLTAYAGGSLPDLLQLGNTWIPEFAALHALAPLDQRIAASASIDPGDYFPGILATNVVDGVTWGVPWYVDTRVLFYRKDLLARAGVTEPPTSWDAWRDALVRLRKLLGPDGQPILLPLDTWEPQVILALQLGGELLRDDARYGNFRSEAFRRAFAFYLDLFHRGLAPTGGEALGGSVYRDFAAGRLGMWITGPWDLGELSSRLPPELSNAWATAPLPSPRGNGPGVSLAGGASLVVTRSARHPEQAWKLVEYLSEPAQQEALHRLCGDLPARRSAWRQGDLLADPRARTFWVQLGALAATPRIPEWERIASRIAHWSEEAVRGRVEPGDALASLDHDADAILEKRRWLLARRAGSAP